MSAQFLMPPIFAGTSGLLSSRGDSELITTLLILCLGFTLGAVIAVAFLVPYFLRRERIANRRHLRRRGLALRDRRFTNPALCPPSRWIAIRTSNVAMVQATFGLNNPMPCTWEEGLNATLEHKLFISPSIGGWVLVMGTSLPDPADDVDRCFRLLSELSRRLGQVQFFSTNRPVNHHAWALLNQGQVERGYAWAGRTIWHQGRPTKAELDLNLRCYDYGVEEDRIDFGRTAPTALNTDRVALLAARWSLDPAGIDPRLMKEAQGVIGAPIRSRAH